MKEGRFRYNWWGRGDIDASLGIFFDGFSKILTASGVLMAFGIPASLILGKVLPGIGLAVFVGNLWYFFEAHRLAAKEQRQDVTAQPFGLGASQLSGWLYLIIGPVYWQTKDPLLALQVGLAANLIGGFIEIIGGFAGPWIVKHVPQEALMGNMASSALVWLSVVGMAMVFDRPVYGLLPLLIIIIDYMGKADRRFQKIPSGVIAVLIGTVIAWSGGYLTMDNLMVSFSEMGFYPPMPAVKDLAAGLKGILPFLPVLIPLQINNFLSTLQGLEAAKAANDAYPERSSMIMDGVSTITGAVFGSPFPTTVYFGHPGWKALGARAGFCVVNAVLYLVICTTGLTGVLMALIPTEAVMVLLIFVGFSVADSTFRSTDKKYYSVILLSMIPILFQYIQSMIGSAVQAAGSSMEALTARQFAAYSIPIQGIKYLGNGAFLSSLLLAGLLACVTDHHYGRAGGFALALTGCSAVGLIHCDGVALFSETGILFGVIYLITAAVLFQKSCWLRKNKNNQEVI